MLQYPFILKMTNNFLNKKISTKVKNNELYTILRAQGSVGQNFWLPVDQDRQVYVASKNTESYLLALEIIGYREF